MTPTYEMLTEYNEGDTKRIVTQVIDETDLPHLQDIVESLDPEYMNLTFNRLY